MTQFTDMLQTHSDHSRLPSGDLRALLQAVAEVVVAQGGRITVHDRTRLLTAVRRGGDASAAR